MNESSETGPPPSHPHYTHSSLSETFQDSGEVLLWLSGPGLGGEGAGGRDGGGGAWAWTAQQALGEAAKGRGPQEQAASVRPQEAPASQKSQEQRVQGG